MCDTVGYIPEDYSGQIKCPNCGCKFKRTGRPLSETRKYLLESLDKIEKTGFYKKVKWSTARDEHVCDECKKKEGVLYTFDEMRNILLSDFCKSDHFEQNCRCLVFGYKEKLQSNPNSKVKIKVTLKRDKRNK